MSALVPQQAEALERLIVDGDLSRLSAEQRLSYYYARCEAAGLDPRAQPFQYLQLSGRLVLYATKACTDQLIAQNRLSATVLHSQTLEGEVYEVTARVTRADGTTVDDVGCVSLGGTRGEARCNAIMKAVTKAKRRAVLSACGLGMMDESETGSIQGAQRVELQQVHQAPAAPPALPPAAQPQVATDWADRVAGWLGRINGIGREGTRDQLLALQEEIRAAAKAAPRGQGLPKGLGAQLRAAFDQAESEIGRAEDGNGAEEVPAQAEPENDLRAFARLLASVPQARQHADVAAIREESQRVLPPAKALIVGKACDERDAQLAKRRPARGGDET